MQGGSGLRAPGGPYGSTRLRVIASSYDTANIPYNHVTLMALEVLSQAIPISEAENAQMTKKGQDIFLVNGVDFSGMHPPEVPDEGEIFLNDSGLRTGPGGLDNKDMVSHLRSFTDHAGVMLFILLFNLAEPL